MTVLLTSYVGFVWGLFLVDKLIEELKYAKGLTIQYYFGTERALSYLKKL